VKSKPFTGRLSLGDKLLTDRASGEIYEERTEATIRWRGAIRFPNVKPDPFLQSSSLRLDCTDGFKILIDLERGTRSSGSQWIDATFVSNGSPIK